MKLTQRQLEVALHMDEHGQLHMLDEWIQEEYKLTVLRFGEIMKSGIEIKWGSQGTEHGDSIFNSTFSHQALPSGLCPAVGADGPGQDPSGVAGQREPSSTLLNSRYVDSGDNNDLEAKFRVARDSGNLIPFRRR